MKIKVFTKWDLTLFLIIGFTMMAVGVYGRNLILCGGGVIVFLIAALGEATKEVKHGD